MGLPWRLLLLFILLIAVYCWKSSQLIIAPKRFIFPYNPLDFGLSYQPVKLITSDNITLDAWFIPATTAKESGQGTRPYPSVGAVAPKATIIACHGYGSAKGDCIDIARFLVPENYNILTFDFRGHGESDGKYSSLGYYEIKDIESAIKWLVNKKEHELSPPLQDPDTAGNSCLPKKGEEKIGIIGFSMGGTVALIALANNPNVKAVVSDGAYVSFNSAVTSFAKCYFKAPKYPFIPPAIWTAGLRLKLNPDKLDLTRLLKDRNLGDKAVLIIHGGRDKEIPVSNAREIFSVLRCNKELWIIPEAQHLESHYIKGKEYENKIINFFNSTLLCR